MILEPNTGCKFAANTKAKMTIFCLLSLRDNENAFVSVNDFICWTKEKLNGGVGEQQCGNAWWKSEEKFRVTGCEVSLSGSTDFLPLTVRVWTNLDGEANDESFGIDNVIIVEGRDHGICDWAAWCRSFQHTRTHTQRESMPLFQLSFACRDSLR